MSTFISNWWFQGFACLCQKCFFIEELVSIPPKHQYNYKQAALMCKNHVLKTRASYPIVLSQINGNIQKTNNNTGMVYNSTESCVAIGD